MKTIMKSLLCILLSLLTVASFTACLSEDNNSNTPSYTPIYIATIENQFKESDNKFQLNTTLDGNVYNLQYTNGKKQYTGFAYDTQEVYQFTIKHSNVQKDILSNRSRMEIIINKALSGNAGQLTGYELDAVSFLLDICEICEVVGQETDIAIDRMLNVMCLGETYSSNNWSVNVTLNEGYAEIHASLYNS